jgi:hypothetical protein
MVAAMGRGRWKAIAAAAAALLAFIGAIGLAALVLNRGDAELISERSGEEEIVVAAKAAVNSRMAGAQEIGFGSIRVHWTGDIPAVCGAVDIVEEQDSFDGDERFIYSDGALLLEEADGTDTLDQRWRDLCE